MFDKFKARIEKLEETNETFRKVSHHVQEHKVTYISVPLVFTAGYLLKSKTGPDVIQSFTDSTDNIATVVNRSKNVKVVIKYLNQRNYPANPVRCLETLEEWASQAEAALAKGISETNLSQHLSGKYPHANGLHFERIIL